MAGKGLTLPAPTPTDNGIFLGSFTAATGGYTWSEAGTVIGGPGQSVTVSGGSVTATGGSNGAGIGGGADVHGGSVTGLATADRAGIPVLAIDQPAAP